MSHSPGPWVVDPVQWIMHQPTGMGYSYRPIHSGALEVAQVWEDDDDSEMAANVHLIAAAPELLEALKVAANAIDYGQAQVDSEEDRYKLRKWLVQVRRVIYKAEGKESE